MGFIKDLFKKKKKERENEEPECWYNNFSEKKKGRIHFSEEAADVGASFSPEVGSAKSISQQQT